MLGEVLSLVLDDQGSLARASRAKISHKTLAKSYKIYTVPAPYATLVA